MGRGLALVVNDNTNEQVWNQFTDRVVQLMLQFEKNELELTEVDEVLASFQDDVDGAMIDFVFNTMTEIGGAPGDYRELLDLMQGQPDRGVVRKLMGH